MLMTQEKTSYLDDSVHMRYHGYWVILHNHIRGILFKVDTETRDGLWKCESNLVLEVNVTLLLSHNPPVGVRTTFAHNTFQVRS